jgi:hypothetical protein
MKQSRKGTTIMLRTVVTYLAVLLLAGCDLMGSKQSSIVVESDPEGAQLFLNGILHGVTPFTVSGLAPGEYLVELRKHGFEEVYSEIALLEGQKLKLELQLKKALGLLLVGSNPGGSEVLVEGVHKGRTPVLVTDLPLGSYQVEIRASVLQPRIMNVEMIDRTPVQAVVRHAPRVAINSYPAGAEILIDDEPYGQAPLVLSDLPEGEHQVTAVLDQHDTQVQNVLLTPGLNSAIEFNLEKNSGTLVLDTEPALVQVYVDGTLVATTQPKEGSDSISQPLHLHLKAGVDHNVQLVREGFNSISKTVRTEVDQIRTRHEVLKHIFVYDTKITTDKEVILCRIEYKLPNGDIYYERYPGVYHTSKAAEIRDVQPISLDDESNRAARRMIEESKLAVPE